MAEAIKMGGGTSKIPNGQRVLAYSLGEKVKSNTFVKSTTDLRSEKPKVNQPNVSNSLIEAYAFENSFDDNAILCSFKDSNHYYLKIIKINDDETFTEGSWLQVNFPIANTSYSITNKKSNFIIVDDYIIFLSNQKISSTRYATFAVLCKRTGMEISFLSCTSIFEYTSQFNEFTSGVAWFYYLSKMKENNIAINICCTHSYYNSFKYKAVGVICNISNNSIVVKKNLYDYSNDNATQRNTLNGIDVHNSADGELGWVNGVYSYERPSSDTPFFQNPLFFRYNGDVVNYSEMTANVQPSLASLKARGYIHPLGANKYLINNYDADISGTGFVLATIDLVNKRITFPTAFYRDEETIPAFIIYKDKVYLIRGTVIFEFLTATNTMLILTNSVAHKIYQYAKALNYAYNEYNNIKYSYINDNDYITFFIVDSVPGVPDSSLAYYVHNEIPVDRWLPECIVVDDTSVTKDNLYGVTQTICNKNKKGKVTTPLSV